ncbi:uncharacterized protein [Miscanthus floridulus]|uniref:uncharacterized protein n=1 Tax=Miscanthus floridulus TaxID=154761 RepID=UPI0034587D99
MSVGEEQEAAWRAEVPASRKHAASADVVGGWAAKRTQSPCPSVVPPIPSSPMADAAEQDGRPEGRIGAPAVMGPVPTADSQPEEALLAVGAVEQSGRSEGQTSARTTRDLQSEDAPPTAPVRESQAGGHSDPQAGQEPVGMTLPPSKVRGRGSQPGSGPRPVGPLSSEPAFRVVPLTSRGRGMPGLSIAPTPMQETWRPTLQRVAASEGGSRVAAAKPSLPGVVPPGAVADKAVAAASVLVVILVPLVGVTSGVTLAAPPPPVAVEETREGELPISSGGGMHGLSLPSELKAPEGRAAGIELGHLVASHANEVVEIPSDDEADIAMGPPMSPQELVVSPRELAVVRSEAGPSGGLPEGDLEWPCPEDPSKACFALRDSRECQLWDIFGWQGHVAVSELTKLSAKLESARKQAQFTRQLVEVNLQLAAEEIRKMSSCKSYFLRTEHARMAELERRVESACRKSQVRTAKAATARAKGQRAAERATAAKQGLEAAKVCQEETEAGLRASLANTEAALQEALAALEPERATLESAQKALEPVSELVALLPELGEKVKALERDLEATKASFSQNVKELAKSHEERRALEGDLDQICNAA